ncbi:MAG: glycosyltransferase family A protein [Actinomycetota bacterium]|nr:glycosyltransferase family A protein [Actinomycetota bacterium]
MIESLVIAICTRARPDTLTRLLSSLKSQDWPAEVSVLVVDNDVAQSARSVVEDFAPSFPVALDYLTQERSGYSSVRNTALDHVAVSTAVCFIDDDAVVPPAWVQEMRAQQLEHPSTVIRSRYLHVPSVPVEDIALQPLVDAVNITELSPAGTSGLLLPAKAFAEVRFDPYFDLAGTEDMDLLARMSVLGFVELIADTVVIEEDRVRPLAWSQQRELAKWNGRLATIAMAHRGSPTLAFRARALLSSAWALCKSMVRLILGRKQAGHSYLNFAVSRWGMATAPFKPPAELPARPVL